jgi:hypothetical protein
MMATAQRATMTMATATGNGATGYDNDNDGDWQRATKSTMTEMARRGMAQRD